MSLGNLVAVLGAGMGGYLKGRQQKREEEQADSEAEWRDFQRQQIKDQAARDAALRGDLQTAGTPATMQEVGGKPDTMDNADVGQPGEAPVAPNSFTVNGQNYADADQAQKAVTAANAPDAQSMRIAAAYNKNGQPAMAMQVRQQQQQAELTKLGLDEKHLEFANRQFDDLLQQQSTHEALAAFVSSSQHDGQGGNLKVQAVPSTDGKTVTYAKVNEDGSVTPTGHTFTNDQAGLEQAQLWLSRATPLGTKIANLHQQASDKLAADKEVSESAERAARARYYDSIGAAAGIKADKAGASKYDRMDENDKLELQAAYTASKEVDGLINKGVADGTLKKGDESYNFLMARKAAADLKARSVLQRYADTSAQSAQTDPLGLRGGSSGSGMSGAASQATADTDAGRLIIANEFGGDVAKAQAYVTARRAEAAKANGDAKQIMNSEADRIQRGIDLKNAPAAAPAPGAAPTDATARRVAPTPVVNFNPSSGGNARMKSAASKLPALEAAVSAAKDNLAAAKGKGPMAVSAARDQWNNAKTALAEAKLRSGDTVETEDN